MGRFLKATKEIPEGELIFTEAPMIIGPKQLTKPVCLGCHKEITSTTPFIKCIRCNWPVCSQKCMVSVVILYVQINYFYPQETIIIIFWNEH